MPSAQLKKFTQVKPAQLEWRGDIPFNLEFDDVYFSTQGGLEETQHVFIEGNQLLNDWQNKTQACFYLVELGFGSGLNFLATLDCWSKKNISKEQEHHNNINKPQKHLHYISIEKRPLHLSDLIKACKHWPQFQEISEQLIMQYPSPTYGRYQLNFEQYNVTLTLLFMPVDEALKELNIESNHQQQKIKVDHWFLDGFAPSKNTSMWSKDIFQAIAKLSKQGTRFATYTVAAAVKTPLKSVGFILQKRPGVGKKREVLTGVFNDTDSSEPNKNLYVNIKYEKPWFDTYSRPENKCKKIAIIGGGIAGCATAFYLSRSGHHVTLYEKNKQLATEASGAAAGIFHPQITSDFNLASQFSWQAFVFLTQFLSCLTPYEKELIRLRNGVYKLISKNALSHQLKSLTSQLNLTQWLEIDDSKLATSALLYSKAGALNMNKFCSLLIEKSILNQQNLLTQQEVLSLDFEDRQQWRVTTKNSNTTYDEVIFTQGANHKVLNSMITFPVKITRGQTSIIESHSLAENLKNILCEQSYIVPEADSFFHTGSTFESWNSNNFDYQLDEQSQKTILTQTKSLLNLSGFKQASENISLKNSKLSGKVGYRLHSPDRFPIVGGIPDIKKINHDFNNLGQTRIRRDKLSEYNLPGLWINSAYGSHGLLYSMIASKHLSSLINHGISPLSNALAYSVHPNRFLVKKLKKPST